ncbi:MAG: discoidin domain-containing protein [Bacteroidaceae bacterium]|nr:discoidin domain-containing protein [Bacteroidaceae bacterium]
MKRIQGSVLMALAATVFVVLGAHALDKEDGVYVINDGADLNAFAKIVNGGERDASCRLTTDIDYTAYNDLIGDGGVVFVGHFDGQGHKVFIDTHTDSSLPGGLFGKGSAGAKIENLWLEGTLTASGRRASGLIREGDGVFINNCVIKVDIVSTYTGAQGDLASGGVIGWCSGNNTLKNVIYEGTITNEVFDNCRVGGLVGWVDDPGTVVENCLAIMEINLPLSGDFKCNSLVRTDDNCTTVTNSYYVNFWNAGIEGASQVTAEQVKSGEVCYLLNGDQTTLRFWQTIGQDEFPVPMENGHEQVFLKNGKYVNSDAEMIGTAAELSAFAKRVNGGENNLSARLTADIDYTGYNDLIGDGVAYVGTFDGLGHKVTIDTHTNSSVPGGLFGKGSAGARILNLWLDGTLTASGRRASGLIREGDGVYISNCLVTVDIVSTYDGGQGDLAGGGIIGWCSGNNTLKNVAYKGKVTNDVCTDACVGGLVGWVDDPGTVVENGLAIMEVSIPATTTKKCNALVRGHLGEYTISNSYYVNPLDAQPEGTVQVTEEQLASGEVAFRLNGNQTAVGFWQTIGEDPYPVPVERDHKTVYGKGDIHCNGQPYDGGSYSFSNTPPNQIDSHEFVDGICVICGAESESADLSQDADGYYLIADANQLAKAIAMVNEGNLDMSFRLTDDIDFTDAKYVTTTFNGLGGTFDGQNHAITLATNKAGASLFGGLSGTVKNLVIRGEIITSGQFAGALSGLSGSCDIENVVVEADIVSTYDGHNGEIHLGGFIGRVAGDGVATLVNCVFSGNIIQNDDACIDRTGGFVGDSRGSFTLRNCLMAGDFHITGGVNLSLFANGGTKTNCFYLKEIEGVSTDAGTKAGDDIRTGKLCYQLNGGAYDNPVWRQTIGEDEIPYPIATEEHGIVYYLPISDRYMDVHDDESMHDFIEVLCEEENEWVYSVQASTDITSTYEEYVNVVAGSTTLEYFYAAYKRMREYRVNLEESERAYADYNALAQEALAFLKENAMEGEDVNVLKSYLTETQDPDDTFKNGSYPYVMENAELSTADIRAEREFLAALYRVVVATAAKAGTDVTVLLTNADLADGSTGWQGKAGSYFDQNSGIMPVAEAWRTNCDMYQELTGLANGVYELDINAFYRPSGHDEGFFYGAQVYANDNLVPVMIVQEDPIAFEKAVDMENCYIANAGSYPYDVIFNDFFFYPNSYTGATYAFHGGRYVNRILAVVTDGTLKVGIRNLGTGFDYDWLVFGGAKLTYRGSLEEAGDAMMDVLIGQCARALTATMYGTNVGDEYYLYPNYSAELRKHLEELRQNTIGINRPLEPAEAYAYIEDFSKTFAELYDCKRAYIYLQQQILAMTNMAENYSEAGILNQDDYNAFMKTINTAAVGYQNGSFSAQEAWDFSLGTITTTAGEALITDAKQLSSNASDQAEGQHIEYLVDNNAETFWHTDWHNQVSDPLHYVQVKLNANFAGDVTLYLLRRNSANDHPTKMKISGSLDGKEFEELGEVFLPFKGVGTPVAAGPVAISEDKPVRYLRVAATDTGNADNPDGGTFRTFWHTAELQLFGQWATGISAPLLLEESGDMPIYNTMGQRLNVPIKGINIIGGKKVWIK